MIMESGDYGHQKNAKSPLPTIHPLKYDWALWHLGPDRKKEWKDCLNKVVVIRSVEDFWSVYLQIARATELPMGSDYYLFKDGIKPMWEDSMNVKGGRWVYPIDKRVRGEKVNDLWLITMLSLISEQFDDDDDFICGAAVNIRPITNKIALWITDASLEKLNNQVAFSFISKLQLSLEAFYFEAHQDSSTRDAFTKLAVSPGPGSKKSKKYKPKWNFSDTSICQNIGRSPAKDKFPKLTKALVKQSDKAPSLKLTGGKSTGDKPADVQTAKEK